MEVAILFGLILLNGAFAMSEIALVTTRRANLQQLVDEGDRGAAAGIAPAGQRDQHHRALPRGDGCRPAASSNQAVVFRNRVVANHRIELLKTYGLRESSGGFT